MNNNILIARFMGVEHLYEAQSSNMFNQYHEDWNRLMPVAEKIMWDNDIDDNECTNIADALCDAKIDRVYNAVVEFIKAQTNTL
tara:strand:+ start:1180 stop:1431 length:252 start_codon:yes stop_codon:yes gene_type:complete